MSHTSLEKYSILCLFSGWRLVLLVILVEVLSNVWRRALHENPLLHKPSPSVWRRHLPWPAHWGSTLQHTALSRYGPSARPSVFFMCHWIRHSWSGNKMPLIYYSEANNFSPLLSAQSALSCYNDTVNHVLAEYVLQDTTSFLPF